MELPLMPNDNDCDNDYNYRYALEAWERVCEAIIEATRSQESQEHT